MELRLVPISRTCRGLPSRAPVVPCSLKAALGGPGELGKDGSCCLFPDWVLPRALTWPTLSGSSQFSQV